MNLKPIGVKITRAEKRNRKIIIVIEPDLFSNEVFAATPFYEEGPEKNRLQHANFSITVKETEGKVDAKVVYDGYHSTKGYRQLHGGVGSCFLDKKDCALNWVMTESEEYLEESRLKKVLDMWEDDQEFQSKIQGIYKKRKIALSNERFESVKSAYHHALKRLEAEIENRISTDLE